MRRVPRRISILGCCAFAAFLSVLGLSGCSGGFQGATPGSSSTGQGSSIKVSQPVSVTVVAGQTATFSVTATGTGPFTYQWYENGTPISGVAVHAQDDTSMVVVAGSIAGAEDAAIGPGAAVDTITKRTQADIDSNVTA